MKNWASIRIITSEPNYLKGYLAYSHWLEITKGQKWEACFAFGDLNNLNNQHLFFNFQHRGSLLVKTYEQAPWEKSKAYCDYIWQRNYQTNLGKFENLKFLINKSKFNKFEGKFDVSYFGTLDKMKVGEGLIENKLNIKWDNIEVGDVRIDFWNHKPFPTDNIYNSFNYPLAFDMYEGAKEPYFDIVKYTF